jgi:hypothetical protein
MKKLEEYQDKLEDFNESLADLIDGIDRDVPPYEVVYSLIASSVDVALTNAPNPFVAFKTILASVEAGIASFEEMNKRIE